MSEKAITFEEKLKRFKKRESNKKLKKSVLSERIRGGYGFMKNDYKRTAEEIQRIAEVDEKRHKQKDIHDFLKD